MALLPNPPRIPDDGGDNAWPLAGVHDTLVAVSFGGVGDSRMASDVLNERQAPAARSHPAEPTLLERGLRLARGGRRTLADDLRLQLADDIVRGVLAPGAALDETELARRFRVSRTPVREAIRQLAASG